MPVKFERCYLKCPCGQPCVCNRRITHGLHICKDAGCDCHGERRYADAKRERKEMRKELEESL